MKRIMVVTKRMEAGVEISREVCASMEAIAEPLARLETASKQQVCSEAKPASPLQYSLFILWQRGIRPRSNTRRVLAVMFPAPAKSKAARAKTKTMLPRTCFAF